MAKNVDYDLVCLSHLRWNFVFQRPQHLLTRFARSRRVFFIEEPEWHEGADTLQIRDEAPGVRVVVPMLAEDVNRAAFIVAARIRSLVDQFFVEESIRRYVLWFYTPMALSFASHLKPLCTVYDCMDDLSGFAGAPPELPQREAELLTRADLVTVGGQALFDAKRGSHRNIHLFPSSIDAAHFAKARRAEQPEPPDQRDIPHPRVGFAGVIDERMDLPLLAELATERPDLHLCLLGPITKIDPSEVPALPNVHLLGAKPYDRLPAYMAGWDVAMLPFAHNSATRFISPTKTPEYLAAGLPVVSTSIRDVVRPYGQAKLVRIADDAATFAAAIDASMLDDRATRLRAVDAFLKGGSWDITAQKIAGLLADAIDARHQRTAATAAGVPSIATRDVA